MCGIAGVISIKKNKNLDESTSGMVSKLMDKLEIRGTDAWGGLIVPTKKNISLYCFDEKENMGGQLFKIDKKFSDWALDLDGSFKLDGANMILLHTRASSYRNCKENMNNHPFYTNDFVLSHNGTISNHRALKTKFNLDYKIETDSYILVALIQHFVNEGYEVYDAIRAMADSVDGSFACWLYDKRTHNVYLFRRNNPISVYRDNNKGYMVFASTDNIIANSVEQAQYSDIEEIDEEIIYQVEKGSVVKLGSLKTEEELEDDEEESENDTVHSKEIVKEERFNAVRKAVDAVTTTSYDQKLKNYIDKLKVMMFRACGDNHKIAFVCGIFFITFENVELFNAIKETDWGNDIQLVKNYYRLQVEDTDLADFIRVVWSEAMSCEDDEKQVLNEANDVVLITALDALSKSMNISYHDFAEGIELLLERNPNDGYMKTKSFFSNYGLWFRKNGLLYIKKNGNAYKQLVKVFMALSIY